MKDIDLNSDNPASTVLPIQRKSIKEKGEEWKKQCVNYFERLAFTTFKGKRTTNSAKLINYDLFNGKFNVNDLEYVCNPIGVNADQFPATLQHYDIMSPALMLLMGEETKRPDNTIVVSEGVDSVNRKTKQLKDKITQSLTQSLMGQIDPSTIDPNNPPQPPEEIIKYEKYTPSDLIESKANKMLKVLKKRLVAREVFKKGWKDVLLVGEEIYWTGIVNGEPMMRRCNPPDISVFLDSNSDFVDEAIAVCEVRMMSVASIIEEFGDDLTPAQIDTLERLAKNYYAQTFPATSEINLMRSTAEFAPLATTSSINNPVYGNIRVVRVEWMSLKKLGTLSYTDEFGQPQMMDIDESFNLTQFKEVYKDAKVEWFWVNEPWEGTKIGRDMFVNIQPKPNQRRRLDNPYYSKLGYTGLIYNSTNSVSVSLLDRMKPYQYLYNILMYRLELAFASDQGKVMLMDLAQMPRTEGIDTTKWLYYLKAMKIAFINSAEEAQKGSRIGQTSQFQAFKEIDLSLANTIQQYINSLEYIKQQLAFLSGISPQRLGAIAERESVGGVERSVNQSALITEYWFDMHNEVKRRTYQALIEVAKIAYKEGTAFQYVLDDMGIEMLHINELELEDSEFAVFMSNATKDQQAIETVKQLFQTALQADKVALSDIVDILKNDSLADISHLLKDSEAKAREAQAQAQQQEQQIKQAEIAFEHNIKQTELDLERERLDREDINKELDRENKIQLETIKALGLVEGMSKSPDMNQNLIPDVLEQSKIALEQTKHINELSHKQNELAHKKDIENKKINLEKEKIASNERIEQLKIKQDKINNKSEEKIAKQDQKLKAKEIEVKKIAAKKKPSGGKK